MNNRRLYLPLVVLCIGLIAAGCEDDETTAPPPSGALSLSSNTASTPPGASTTVTISGGTSPYTIETGPDTVVATATLSGSTLTVNGVASAYTSLVVRDGANARVRLGIAVTGPITLELFPLTLGRQFVYSGYAISTTGAQMPDPNNVYRSSWTLISFPVPGFVGLLDSTTLRLANDTTVVRVLGVAKLSGSFVFLQTLGPFFRAFGINRTDTVRAIPIAVPAVGIGGTWPAFDSTYPGPQGNVRLEIIGLLEAGETITDSSATHVTHDVVRFRTYRRISVGGSVIVDNATTARIWLKRDVGPIQVHIAQDTENIGHFRVMRQKNF